MAQLIVRNLDEKVVERLKQRAARHGCSAEAEHRDILEQVLLGPERKAPSLKELLLEVPEVGEDANFARPRDLGRSVDL